MKKLFENWRRFKKDILNEQFTTDAIGYQEQGHTLDKLKCDAKKYPQCAELVDLGRQILSIGIPPLAIPEFKGAMQTFTDNPSLQNAGAAALALLASIPHFKGLTAAEKLSKTKQVIKTAEETSAAMKGAPQYEKLASKIDDAVASAEKELKGLIDWATGGKAADKTGATILKPIRPITNLDKLKKAANSLSSLWKKDAYRGEGFNTLEELAQRLDLPSGIKNDILFWLNRAKKDPMHKGWFGRTADDFIELPIENLVLKPKNKIGAMSFSKKIDIAETFAANPLYKQTSSSRIQVMYIVDGKKVDNLIDIESTLQGATRSSTEIDKEMGSWLRRFLKNEKEILATGSINIDSIAIRILD
jgi:hypothetical protein